MPDVARSRVCVHVCSALYMVDYLGDAGHTADGKFLGFGKSQRRNLDGYGEIPGEDKKVAKVAFWVKGKGLIIVKVFFSKQRSRRI